jgi:hypothetical protein
MRNGLSGPLCASLREFCTPCGRMAVPAARSAAKRDCQPAEGLRRDIKGRGPLAGWARCLLAVLLSAAPGLTHAQQQLGKAPETFIANAQAGSQVAGASAMLTIQINRYTDERDVKTMLEELRLGGYPRLLPVLRKMPDVGHVEMAGRKVTVRWARQIATDKGRHISVVGDSPLLFLGGAAVDAKPRAGYELTVVLFDVDSVGLGSGTMAAAARIRPGGESGVQLDDYAEQPIKLATVRKSLK